MLFAHWIVLVAGLMPYVLVGAAKAAPGYDNHHPRAVENLRSASRRRAYDAHLNALEAFPLFAVGVVLATILDADARTTNLLAAGWLLARLGFVFAYITDRPSARTALWLVATAASAALYVTSLVG